MIGNEKLSGLSRRSALAAIGGASGLFWLSPACRAASDARRIVSVREFGAAGDGRTDDSVAFMNAMATGQDVLVPRTSRAYRVTRTLALSRPGQRVLGEEGGGRVIQAGNGENATVFVTEHDGCEFRDLDLVPGTDVRALYQGWGVAIVGARGGLVAGCRFSGMRRGGVLLRNANETQVIGNLFERSVVRGDGSEPQRDMGYDIFLAERSSRNLIEANRCVSGVGVGVGCQTVTSGASQFDNIMRRNVIRNQPCYGVMVYQSDPADQIDRFVIEQNEVDGISGAVHTDGRTRFYGSGVYLQTSNDFIVRRNVIRRTNFDRRLPFSDHSVPAAIAVSGVVNGTIEENQIDQCHHGIASIGGGRSTRPTDRTSISRNVVTGADGDGVRLLDCNSATLIENRMTGVAGRASYGVRLHRVTAPVRGGFIISGNQIADFTVGIEAMGDGIPSVTIRGNAISGTRGMAIASSAIESIVESNDLRRSERGVRFSQAVRRRVCSGNLHGGSLGC